MKLTVMKPTEVEASFIRINVPVRYGTEDIPVGFPFRRPRLTGEYGQHDRWDIVVNIDSGQIQGWPAGRAETVHMKVCDEGIYTLLDHHGEQMAEVCDYVPDCVPEGGDYVSMSIHGNGVIDEWDECVSPITVANSFFPKTDY